MQAIIKPIETFVSKPSIAFLDTCTCCGHDFTSTDFEVDFGVCPDCESTSQSMLEKIVNDTINGTINRLAEEGGYDDLIAKLKSLSQAQRNKLVERWASR